jgi:hypothetical protein
MGAIHQSKTATDFLRLHPYPRTPSVRSQRGGPYIERPGSKAPKGAAGPISKIKEKGSASQPDLSALVPSLTLASAPASTIWSRPRRQQPRSRPTRAIVRASGRKALGSPGDSMNAPHRLPGAKNLGQKPKGNPTMPTNQRDPCPGPDPSDPLPDPQAHLRRVAAVLKREVKEFAADDPDRQASSPTGKFSVIAPHDHQTWRGPGK